MFNKLQQQILKDFLKENYTKWIIYETEDHKTIISDGYFAIKIPDYLIMINFKNAACRRSNLDRCFNGINPAILKKATKTGTIKEDLISKKKRQLVEFQFENELMYVDKKFLDLLELEKTGFCDFRAYDRYKPLCVMDQYENIIAVICPVKIS